MSMGSLKTLTEDHHCHDILLDPSILTDHGQWHADPSSNSSSDFSPDLGSESDATTVGDKHQTPQGTQGLSSTMATDQPTLPSEGSKSSDEGSNSPSPLLSSSEEGDLARSELSHGAESCQLDPVPGSFKETTVLGTDSMSPSHVSVNNVDRPNQPGDGDDKSDVMTGQSVQRGGEGAGEEKSCPPIRRDVSQEITILVTSHDTCVGDEEEGELEEEGEVEEEEEEEKEREEGKEESKKARNELERESSSKNIREEETRALSQDAVTPADREAAVEGSIVVANLTSTSQVEIPQIVGSNSLETGRDRASNAQCEDTEVTSGNQEASDPISSSSSDCLLEAQTEAKRPTELNKPLVDVVSTDLSSQCISQTKSVPTESEPVTVSDNTTTDHKNVGQLSTTTNKSSISDSKERLQKAKTLDLSSSRFSASPRKTATVQGQSSLEVVACHSVATSPMTPPEGSGAFLFPYSSAKLGTGNGNIEEKREFRSVATAPMSPQNLTAPEALPDVRTAGVEMISVATAPMTPQNLTAPEGIPDVRTAGVEMRSVATAPMTPQHLTAPEAIPDTHSAGVEMISVANAPMTPQNLTAPESIPDVRTEMRSVATAPMTPQTLTAPEELPDVRTAGMEMRSVATAPMTPQNLTAPEAIPDVPTAGVETRSVATAPMTPQNLTAPESIPDVHTERRSVATAPMTPQTLTAPEELPDVRTAGMEMRSVATAPMTPQNLTAPEAIPDVRTAGVEMRSVATAPMSPQNLTAPESIPDTRKVGSVQTQKSLEVMYNSVATSPMTPPGGSTAFLFPKPNKIELRSMATAPMSPQGLVAPEVIPETCPSDQEEPTSPDIIPEPRACEPSNALPEPPDPVQDVSWDEKGMTWDVYGAVVEVAVLGTAIQKHLEKQVQKQRKQTSSDAGSPTKSQHSDQNLTQSQSPADTQSSDDRVSSAPATGPVTSGSQKRRHPKEEKSDSVKRNGRRKNPLRGRFRRLQWPSCCSRSRAEEVP